MRLMQALGFLVAHCAGAASVLAVPSYTIVEIGRVNTTDTVSQGFRVSSNGIATGRSVAPGTTGAVAYTWTQAGGIVGLPNLTTPARAFSVGNGVNDNGVVVGTGATSLSGSSPLPLIWQGGVVSQLPLPAGQTLGRANDVNNSLRAVGSAGGGSLERGVIYDGGSASIVTATTSTGCFVTTLFGINQAGLSVGNGIDPGNAARNVGFVYDSVMGSAFEVGALPGMNGALCFDVSDAGHIVGSSMLNQGSGTPYIYTIAGGMTAIPLAAGTSQGSARGVNSSGWVVGTDSGAFAIPFLWDGTQTYRLQDLIPGGTGWDLSTNTSSSALGISNDGIIVGTGVFNGAIRAYAMIPVPEPTAIGAVAGVMLIARRRARSAGPTATAA